jgi:hypothetical protein
MPKYKIVAILPFQTHFYGLEAHLKKYMDHHDRCIDLTPNTTKSLITVGISEEWGARRRGDLLGHPRGIWEALRGGLKHTNTPIQLVLWETR